MNNDCRLLRSLDLKLWVRVLKEAKETYFHSCTLSAANPHKSDLSLASLKIFSNHSIYSDDQNKL